MRREIHWESRLSQEMAERILEKLDQRMCCERVLKAFGKCLGIPGTVPFYDGKHWVRREWESPVVGQLLGMLRRTNPYGAALEKRRWYEGRKEYYAEANLVEMLKLGCRRGGRSDLSGVDLSGLDLKCVSLGDTILSRPDFDDQDEEWEEGRKRSRDREHEGKKGLYANLTGAVWGPATFVQGAFAPGILAPGTLASKSFPSAAPAPKINPSHGSVFCVSPIGQNIRLAVFYKADGALYFYKLRDGKDFYVCGYSFPDIERPEQVADIYADWPNQCLYAFENDGIHFYHLITGEKTAFMNREFIPVPHHLSVKMASFGPDGKTVELAADMTDGEEGWICWKWHEEPGTLKGRSTAEGRRINQIAMDSGDIERGTDSQRRYLLTGPAYMDKEDETYWDSQTVFRLEDGKLKKMPELAPFYVPCIFRGESLGGIREDEISLWKPQSIWKRMKSQKVFYDKAETETIWNLRSVSWYTGKFWLMLWGTWVKRCRIKTPPFFYESSYAAFDDGALEVNGLSVYHYVMKPHRVKCYTGEPYDSGWHMGCPGIKEKGEM